MRPLLLASLLASQTAWAQEAPPPEEPDSQALPDEAPAPDAEPEAEATEATEPPASEPLVLQAEPSEPVVAPEDAAADADKLKKKKKKPRVASDGSLMVGENLKFTFGGAVQLDLRFRPIKYQYGTYYDPKPALNTISRSELIAKFKMGAKLGKVGMVADLDFALRGFPEAQTLDALNDYQQVYPFRFEPHDLYLYARDLFGARGLDLQVGFQKAMFGVGDQFNPTNNVNPNDIEDPLLFGSQNGNLMLRVDLAPAWNWQLTGILVPLFKPALVPDSAFLAQDTERQPFLDDQTRWNLEVEEALALGEFQDGISLERYATVIRDLNVSLPEFSPGNMQGFFRLGSTLGGVDFALSYYRGFADVPVPIANVTSQQPGQICENPADVGRPAGERTGDCVDGLLTSDVTLGYPRMSVLGFNMAGEAGIGYRLEVGWYFPEAQIDTAVSSDDVTFSLGPLGSITENGPYAFPNGATGTVVDTRPFAKWSLGIDYTFGKHVYLNAQWVHGFVDEFGAGDWIQPGTTTTRASGIAPDAKFNDCVSVDFTTRPIGRNVDGTKCAREYLKPRLGDYVVLGLDVNFAAQRGLVRLFTIWDVIGVYEESWDESRGERVREWHHLFTPEGFSAVIYPSFAWKFGNGLSLEAGALLQFGERWTKFGAPETGGHQIWTRTRYAF